MIKETTTTIKQIEEKEKQLLSDAVMPDGIIKTKIKCTGEHSLTIAMTEEICGSSEHWLLLINSKDTLQRFAFLAVRSDNSLNFDFAQAPKELFALQKNWLCYLVWEDEQGFCCKRLKHAREPLYYSEEKKFYGSQVVLKQEDSQRYWKTLLEKEIDDKRCCLVPVLNEEKNTLAIQVFSSAELKMIREEKVWRKTKMQNEEEPTDEFEFSVVIAAYMAEAYLHEAVDSIIAQDIGFKEHIQLILVDDGSTDGTAAICDKYVELYPENVIVIHKENGGVASARNEGMKYATGKYINFCDSDDKFSVNAFSTVREFFIEHDGEMDVVTMPLYFFEAQTGPHWQNYKFDKGNRVIDLWSEYTASDMFCNASFFIREVTEELTFDGTLPCGEDVKFVAQVLLSRMALGVVTECNYWYRRRNSNDSLINTAKEKKSWYFEYFDNMVFELMKYSKKMYGFVPYFIQNTIMMDLQWRFRMSELPEGVLTKQEEKKYVQKIKKVITMIDDTIVLNQKKMPVDYKVQIFEMKYGMAVQARYSKNDIKLYCGNTYIRDVSDMLTTFHSIKIEHDMLKIEGSAIIVGLPEDKRMQIYIEAGSNLYECKKVEREFIECNYFGRVKRTTAFEGQIPVLDKVFGKTIRIVIGYRGYLIRRLKYAYDECLLDEMNDARDVCGKPVKIFGDRNGIRLLKDTQ